MFIIDVPELDLFKIFQTSQAAGWRRGYGNVFIIVDEFRVLKAKQNGSRLLLDCSEKDFFDYWYDYFDVGTDYKDVNRRLCETSPFIAKCVKQFRGLRLLKRCPYEALMVSLLEDSLRVTESACVPYRYISQTCGVKHRNAMGDSGSVVWNEFPGPCKVASSKKQIEMASNKKFAFKACNLSQDLIDGWIDEYDLPDTNEFFEEYLTKKDIDETKLFGLGMKNVMPRNVKMMKKVEAQHGMKFDDFIDWHLGNVDDIVGIAYTYMKAELDNEGKAGARWA